jgi:hypothetical protein
MSRDDEKTVTLVSCMTEAEAALIAQELQAEGIESAVSGQITGSMRAEAPRTVDVLVRADDVAAARVILQRVREDAREIDWSQVDVGEGLDGTDAES